MKADNNVNQDVLPWEDYQYLVDAVDEIIECRRVLQHTYILGFYLDDDTIEKNLFERHQELLEENTERLHGTVEHRNSTEGEDNTIDSERSVTENSTQVVNLTRVTKNFRLSLLAGIVDGMVQSADAISNSSSLALGNY